MVKLKSKERFIILEGMLSQARTIGTRLPKIELEYNKLKDRRLKGNKDLFRF